LASHWITNQVTHLLFRLHWEVAKWKQQHVDSCSVDSLFPSRDG
jgi:hypothetical protein